ncbi:hypothetical protein LTR84_000700 [Exophiala bonariae]|uniref:Rab-GAP TBC domain-containing protein n=1 Tax=Exophiala bonariae TaxID=1690606 RepID=A0AAV9NRA9_9EURO|nr:hypothetical protein LTR84_000700 [Exophiala bonariae]
MGMSIRTKSQSSVAASPKVSATSPSNAISQFDFNLQGLPYGATTPSKPPVRLLSSTSLHQIPDLDTDASDRQSSSPTIATGDTAFASSNRKLISHASAQDGDVIRTNTTSSTSVRDSQTSLNTTKSPTISSLTSAAVSIPHIRVNEQQFQPDHGRWSDSRPATKDADGNTQDSFLGSKGISLDINIPTGGFADDLSSSSIEFSKRGSMLIDGKRLNQSNRKPSPNLAPIIDDERKEDPNTTNMDLRTPQPVTTRPPPTARSLQERPQAKVLSADEEMLSEKVRSFYAAGTDDQNPTESNTNLATKMGARWQQTLSTDNQSMSIPSLSRATSTTDINDDVDISRHPSMTASTSGIASLAPTREELELAGGLEDWKDIGNADVDRYGFILARAPTNPVDGAEDPKAQRLTRVSTSLQLASETPRRKLTLRRTPSTKSGHSKHTHEQTPPRPTSSQSAHTSLSQGRRSTSSRVPIPGSRNKRLMDSAMDMLTLPTSAQSVIEDGHVHIEDARARRKEIEREEKWRRMARPVAPAKDPKTGLPIVGGGSGSTGAYTFDTSSSKLVERAWKGIPDKWRATAWHSFLTTSASKHKTSLPDSELIAFFHTYQSQPSPDDVQIDIDVPRTINSHIMFRRRYRGGQRLLFRVLHAMSLHFAETGYVQGMAALAVTLLAYYDEEMSFVMLARMWELRGLEALYKHGFGGLMSALNDFETQWLGKGEVGTKLDELNIGPTAYGTRWYLTLFNYTIPFPAQLRVWDVFMLLGDDTSPIARPSTSKAPTSIAEPDSGDHNFGTTLDILHATSAALIDGMRDILLSSDFENGMKVLTSWIPIQDPDLLMRIARAEWKMHLKKSAQGSGTSRV